MTQYRPRLERDELEFLVQVLQDKGTDHVAVGLIQKLNSTLSGQNKGGRPHSNTVQDSNGSNQPPTSPEQTPTEPAQSFESPEEYFLRRIDSHYAAKIFSILCGNKTDTEKTVPIPDSPGPEPDKEHKETGPVISERKQSVLEKVLENSIIAMSE